MLDRSHILRNKALHCEYEGKKIKICIFRGYYLVGQDPDTLKYNFFMQATLLSDIKRHIENNLARLDVIEANIGSHDQRIPKKKKTVKELEDLWKKSEHIVQITKERFVFQQKLVWAKVRDDGKAYFKVRFIYPPCAFDSV